MISITERPPFFSLPTLTFQDILLFSLALKPHILQSYIIRLVSSKLLAKTVFSSVMYIPIVLGSRA